MTAPLAYDLGMSVVPERLQVAGRARTAVVLAVVAIMCDALVAFAAFEHRRTFVAAPRTPFSAPEDDGSYFVAGIGYAAASALRYLVLAGLVVAIIRWRGRLRPRSALAGGLVAVDLGYVVATWTTTYPTSSWYLLRSGTLLASAVVSIVTVLMLRPPNPRSTPRRP